MDIFRAIPLLEGLSTERQRALAPHLRIHPFKKGDHLIEKGSPRRDLGFLLEGSARIVEYTPTGREIDLGLIRPGDHFGELALIDQQPRSASLIAQEPGKLALLPEAQARELILHEPHVAERIMQRLAQALRAANTQRLILARPQARARVYTYLLHTLKREGDQWVIDGLPTRVQLATCTNTTRETATRALAQLLARGILRKEHGRLIVQDLAQLEQEALGEEPS